ncbi:hypothetical protein GLOTRDRAFT_114261 [Gloeophyllum trabeum ATCC 11539]|uniref:Uncharacterized protein n=1 Tax=Gloeophyllum trabeum (strain ATCC 11539 / FP-39264 / Madison 617) TaxID=670483 RepID=S7QJT7_GLOTA|nr:uncharacterized protein GLOTRDRAFT_114261 [Gloeophyllum trabeum ATCC 11539]EPQ59617.1 hypothetical protein GLOTRDRAFT_114261 [Gloeophyllum trabeum ATCC 11539]
MAGALSIDGFNYSRQGRRPYGRHEVSKGSHRGVRRKLCTACTSTMPIWETGGVGF